jgi:hypothetical protein
MSAMMTSIVDAVAVVATKANKFLLCPLISSIIEICQ